jgi:hypothetical protein
VKRLSTHQSSPVVRPAIQANRPTPAPMASGRRMRATTIASERMGNAIATALISTVAASAAQTATHVPARAVAKEAPNT